MHAAPITATPSDLGLSTLPQPSSSATPSFADMLASARSSLADFALLQTTSSDALKSLSNTTPPAPKKNPNNDSVVVPIALPAPVQSPPAAALNDANAEPSTSQSQSAAGQPQPQAPPQSATATSGSAGTGGTSNGSAQMTNGAALPSMAAELGARVALSAQALLSQPSQALASLPHGALPTASTAALAPSLSGAAHGAMPDPTAVLPKLASSAALASATPNATTFAFESALQSAAAQASNTPVTAGASNELAALANTADSAARSGDHATPGTTPAPTSVPLPVTDAVPSLEAAPPPAVAASALDQVVASMRQGNKLGLSQIEIQLKPASLGAVDVKLELTHDGRLAAVISADRSDTLMQLQRGSGELQQALRDAGLQTDSGSLSFNLRGDPQTGDQSSRQPSYVAPLAISGSSDDLLAPSAAAAGASSSAHSGLLNIQV